MIPAALPFRRTLRAVVTALALAAVVPAPAASALPLEPGVEGAAAAATPPQDAAPSDAASEGPVRLHPEARDAISRLRSPYCPGLMLEVCPSTEAALLRDSIQMLAREGWASDSIVAWMLANHGEEWRAVPRTEGAGLWAWVAPPAALLVGLALVVVALRRLRRPLRWADGGSPEGGAGEHGTGGGPGPDGGVAPTVGPEERERLRAAIREMEEREEAGL